VDAAHSPYAESFIREISILLAEEAGYLPHSSSL
jgi:hypothetical protein